MNKFVMPGVTGSLASIHSSGIFAKERGMAMFRHMVIASAIFLVSTMAHAGNATLPGWLAGGWELDAGGRWGDEYWTPPRGGIMLGAGRVGKGEQVASFESMRIGFDENGKLAFWAMPEWTDASKFPMVKQSDTEVVFENAAHDYPQRVRYWREGRLLKAEISLIDGSNAKRFNYKPL